MYMKCLNTAISETVEENMVDSEDEREQKSPIYSKKLNK